MIKNKQGLSFQQKLMNVVYGSVATKFNVCCKPTSSQSVYSDKNLAFLPTKLMLFSTNL